jgi:hypothetical protein
MKVIATTRPLPSVQQLLTAEEDSRYGDHSKVTAFPSLLNTDG